MSQQLLWEIVKGNNAFLVKRKGQNFSTDPFNNTGLQTYSSTGFISREAVAVQAGANQANNLKLQLRKRVRVPQKNRDAKKTGKHTVYSSEYSVKHGVHTVAKSIQKRFGLRRTGLQRAALRKLVLLNRANTVRRVNQLAAEKAQKKK